MTTISFESTVREEDLSQLNRLMSQLRERNTCLSITDYRQNAHINQFCVARNNKGVIVGIASLCNYMYIFDLVGVVQGVVVDKEYRRQGIAKALMEKIITEASRRGYKRLELTSRVERNTTDFYKNLRFKVIPTQVFRMEF